MTEYIRRKEGPADSWVAANDTADEVAENISNEDGLSLTNRQRQIIVSATLHAIARVVAHHSRGNKT